jgi:predicted transposase YbfD/YdcC
MKKDSFEGRLESTKNQITRTKEPEMECSTESTTAHEIKTSCVQSLYEILRQVPDHRDNRGKRYEAALVLVLLLLAKLGGEQSMSGIAEWARLRQEWLAGLLPLKTLPCANTYTYVLIHIDMSELNEAVRQWSHQIGLEREAETLVHWAIDGKVLRGSRQVMPTERDGQEVLNVYAVDSGVVQHTTPIENKGYEAATAQAYVSETDCTGIVITADALHTRPRFARCIRASKGHYVLLVKRNRPELEAEIRRLFALPSDPAYPVACTTTVEKGRGRLTTRRIATSTELNLALQDEWRDIAQVFIIERFGMREGKTFHESVCGLTSLSPDKASPVQLLHWVRTHWHIENRCHWRRDATLGEDACTVRQPHVATVLSLLNSLILAIFDHQRISNARSAMRTFAAFPDAALALLIHPL